MSDNVLSIESGIDRFASARHHLAFLDEWLDDEEITEIAINKAGQVYYEKNSCWFACECVQATYERVNALGTAIASLTKNDVGEDAPILSATLPDGERIQVMLPPACESNNFSVTIRKPSTRIFTLEDYKKQGFFKHIKPIVKGLSPIESTLVELKAQGDYYEFIKMAVENELVIAIAGETSSGKTSFMKGLIDAIDPTKRIITIEDVREIFLPKHDNHVHLMYPSESSGSQAIVTPTSLLKSCMRMNPSRIILSEIRGGETFDFINIAASGHGGSITSLHAGSCSLAFERMALMVLQSQQGSKLPYDVIKRLLHSVIDVVFHVHNDFDGDYGRHITEVWYEPLKKKELSN